ncbi:hypothetical protein [Microbacterium sp. C7(2022)]|nr:hypothetical protein [Microbacterium sp. C7(2022)]
MNTAATGSWSVSFGFSIPPLRRGDEGAGDLRARLRWRMTAGKRDA